MRFFLFVARRFFTVAFAFALATAVWFAVFNGKGMGTIWVLFVIGTLGFSIVSSFSHAHRVHLITDRVDGSTLASRHRRQIEIPFPPDEAFALVDAAIRELPHVETVESAPSSLQIHARVRRMDPYTGNKKGSVPAQGASGAQRDQVRAIIAPGQGTGSLTLVCEPEGGAWVDWFMVDHGANLENVEAISRSITRRVAERRKVEEDQVRETATDKELAVAKLSLLNAQVEPHFLYNTLASAQVLTRSDPARADQLLGHLIVYLRNSVPRPEDSISTLGEELERARAYLEILRIRMGERLALQIQVPEQLKGVPMPPMMLQTLVENAIKHGLEPVTGGGTIWIIARESGGRASVTVADDGRGFSEDGGGTGIGLKNIRERLRLAYGDAASFAIVANFPRGVAATITLPSTLPT
jgi:hypothetical protein